MPPSYNRRQYTNQVYDDDKKKWHFINRYIGKFGAKPIVWYWSKEHAEEFTPKDAEVCEMIKFTEDKTRILRALRFSSVLDFELDDEIKEFLKNNGKLLNEVPKEYVKRELDKIFDSNKYNKFFEQFV